jgi:biopolymer transport protein ExbB
MNQRPLRSAPLAIAALCVLPFLATNLHAEKAEGWWNKDWTQRQKITLDASAIGGAAGESTILLRVSDGNVFASAREDGGDIRFVAADGKTVLPHHVESYDSLMGEAFVWVKLPDVKPGADSFHLYYANANAPAPGKSTDAYGDNDAAVYHFAERGSPPADSTANANNATSPATIAEGAIIGGGLRLAGNLPVTIPASESLTWAPGKPVSLSFWIKPAVLQPEALILSRSEGAATFRLMLDQGIPIVEMAGGAAPVRSQVGNPLPAGTWSHLALVIDGGNLAVFVNGEPYGTTSAQLTAMAGDIILGGDGAGKLGFSGEIDELRFSKAALTPAAIKLAFINQSGSEAALKLLSPGSAETGEAAGSSHMLEHVMLFGDIANNMMFDGWIAVGVCVIMIIIGWTVAIKKFVYLNKIEKGNKEFLRLWKSISTDLTALDHADEATIKSMGGSVDEEDQELMKDSPLYHIYHIGSEEIGHRVRKMSPTQQGLPGRSIQAIRASLDAGLVHENHRLTDGLVYLTISVAGGPYVGLLGTVVGVMITFAIIAKSGEVNVNSIAPGIASALLATVVGLIVAIPALFIYSYLNGRIKNVVSSMQVFIDEFVAKMAEFYRPPNEPEAPGGN